MREEFPLDWYPFWDREMEKLPEWMKNYLGILPSMGTDDKELRWKKLNDIYGLGIAFMHEDPECTQGELELVVLVQAQLHLLRSLNYQNMLKERHVDHD